MRFESTRGASAAVDLSTAITNGLADDSGLYVPERFPQFNRSHFGHVETLPEVARILLEPFFGGDPLEQALPAICEQAFDFPVPLRPLPDKGGVAVLELFHGPTAAFKDVGAQFLAACLQRIEAGAERELVILVATSGDTGGAVAAAFHGCPGIEVCVLYPGGGVSPRQEKQLTCWGDNVRAFRVAGVFDDCQRLVKQAFGSDRLAGLRLSSANSINIGRMLPQAVYYAAAALWHWREHNRPASFIVPTGNLGNALACVWAREMGLPIGAIRLATNANRVIPDYLQSGTWDPRRSIVTLATAMDVGDPSNMERLRHMYGDFETLADRVSAWAVNDEQIRAQILSDYRAHGELWCPHTATGFHVYDHCLDDDDRADTIVVATAHPAKFETVIEPLIGDTITVPPALERLLQLDSHFIDIEPDFSVFAAALLAS